MHLFSDLTFSFIATNWGCVHLNIGEGNGNPLQYSCLGSSKDRSAWWAAVPGVTKSRTRLIGQRSRVFSTAFFLKLINFNWRLITLHYCSGFCHILTWISHGCTCFPYPEPPSHIPPHSAQLYVLAGLRILKPGIHFFPISEKHASTSSMALVPARGVLSLKEEQHQEEWRLIWIFSRHSLFLVNVPFSLVIKADICFIGCKQAF